MSGSIAMCAAGKSRRIMSRYGWISTSKPRETLRNPQFPTGTGATQGELEAFRNIGLGVAWTRRSDATFRRFKKDTPIAANQAGMPADQNLLLTERERQIILVLSEGITNKEIGRRLGLTEGTVKVHLHRIYRK